MAKIKVALQMACFWHMQDQVARDLQGTFKTIADMGYEGIEFAGYYGRSAEELRAMLDEAGLEVAGTHIGLNTLLGDELEKTIEFNRILRNRFLIVPWLPEKMINSKEALLKTAKLFNEIAEKLKSEGMYVGYHNHHVEFKPMNGETPWDIFFKATVPEVVMQLDTGNAMYGGVTSDGLLEIIRKYPGRVKTVHLKEYSSKKGFLALLGEGDINWKKFLSLCETIGGTEWYIIEEEISPFDVAKYCLNNLRKMQQ